MSSGLAIVNWVTIGKIALSWIISPLMGGIIAVIIMVAIRKTILNRPHK